MKNIHPIFDQLVSREQKEKAHNQKAKVFWFTGLSGSGKSTIAQGLEQRLFKEGRVVQVLDGDNVRSGICNNLAFSLEDRAENIRRIAEVSKLFCQSGIICINSFVSPTIAIRQKAKDIIGEEDFIEVYIDTPLEECEKRDVKGLYKKARAGQIKGFTGIDSPYEPPKNSSIIISTKGQSVEKSIDEVYQLVKQHITL